MSIPNSQTWANATTPLFQPFGTGVAISSFNTVSISSATISSINGLKPEDLNPADWSLYEAIGPVNFNNNFLQNVGEISATNPLQITTDSNLALVASCNINILPTNNLNITYGNPNGRIVTNASTILAGQTKANFNTLNAPIINTSTINASTIFTNNLTAISTVSVISTISTSQLSVSAINNLSTINGMSLSSFVGNSGDWSYFPALSTIQAGSNDLITTGAVQAGFFTIQTPSTSYEVQSLNDQLVQQAAQVQDISGVSEFLMGVKSLKLGNPSFYLQHQGGGGAGPYGLIGAINMFNDPSGNGTVQIEDGFGPNTTFSQGILNTSSMNVSSINGVEFSGAGGGSLVISTLATQGFSTIAASIQQGLMSSIVFNPQINPQFNIDMGLGDFGIGLGTGLFAVAVAVPTTVGTLTYGLTKGIASLFENRPVNTITNNTFETFNYASQLQISTLNQQISTIQRFISTIPSTIVINNSNINSTISSCDIEYYTSTISGPPPFLAIRALGDPLQTVSTPWSYSQDVGDYRWVEIPSGGLASNVSTINLSTLTLLPSTILKGFNGAGGVLEVLEADGVSYGQVAAQAYSMIDGGSNGTLFYQSLNNRPGFLDNILSTHTLAYTTDIPAFNPNPSFSTIQVSSINNQPVNFRASQEFYVAENGNDSFNGSASAPFLTIQAAINAAEAISSSLNIINIFVAAGTYTENITFNKGYVALVGSLNSQDVNTATNLIGNISINVANSDDLIGRQVVIQGFQITGGITDTSAFQHTLNIQDCKVFTTSGSCLVINPSTALQRTFITNSEFVQGGTTTDSVIICVVGFIELVNVDIFNQTNNSLCLRIGGSARVGRCYNCNLESGTTATTTANSIVSINSSSTGIHSFGFTNFYYTSASNKTGSPTATGINCAGATTLAVIGCVFTLTGTSDLANNYIINRTGVGAVALASGILQAAPAAFGSCTRIDPSITFTDYITPRITAGTISTSQLQVSSINNQPVATYNPNPSFSSINVLSNISTGSLDIYTGPGAYFDMITSDRGNFLELNLQVANPDPGFITYIKGMDTGLASNQYPAYLAIYPARSTIGVGCTPESSYKFDIGGPVRARDGTSYISTLTAATVQANTSTITQTLTASGYGFISSISTNEVSAVSTITTNFLNVLNPLPFGDPDINYNGYFTLSNGVIRMVSDMPSSNVAMRELLFGDGYLYYQLGNGDFSSGPGQAQGWKWSSMNNNDGYMSYDISGTILNVNNTINTQNVYGSSLVSTNQLVATNASISSATISTLVAPASVTSVGTGSCVPSGVNWDSFTGYNIFQGKQMINSGYLVQTDSSLGGGKGQAVFNFNPVLSSLQTINFSYFANSTSPGLNSIPWCGNSVVDGNNQISTIQIYADAGRDLFISYIGWV